MKVRRQTAKNELKTRERLKERKDLRLRGSERYQRNCAREKERRKSERQSQRLSPRLVLKACVNGQRAVIVFVLNTSMDHILRS